MSSVTNETTVQTTRIRNPTRRRNPNSLCFMPSMRQSSVQIPSPARVWDAAKAEARILTEWLVREPMMMERMADDIRLATGLIWLPKGKRKT
jgi:hypothetical protein